MNPMHWSLHAIHNAEMAALGHTRQSQTQDAIKVKGSKGLRRLVGGSNEFHVGTQVTDTNVVFQENACDPWRKTSAREDICNVQISVTVCTGASSLQFLSKFCIRMYSKKKITACTLEVRHCPYKAFFTCIQNSNIRTKSQQKHSTRDHFAANAAQWLTRSESHRELVALFVGTGCRPVRLHVPWVRGRMMTFPTRFES